jgi:hypothetical protein
VKLRRSARLHLAALGKWKTADCPAFFAFLLAAAMACSAQTVITEPLDFSGLAAARLPLLSERASSWTSIQFNLDGLNVTDPYQPGRPILLPIPETMSHTVRSEDLAIYGAQVDFKSGEPGPGWHTRLLCTGSGKPLSADNLPPTEERGILRQSDYYHWFTRNSIETGGPVGRRAGIILSVGGHWGDQTVAQASDGNDLGSRLLFGKARGTIHISGRDRAVLSWTGSRLRLSNWGVPAGIEALAARRASPSWNSFAGFDGMKEAGSYSTLYAGWMRETGANSQGLLSLRYGYSLAHLDAIPTGARYARAVIDLESGFSGSAPPVSNRAMRDRHSLQADFEPSEQLLADMKHRLTLGVDWSLAGTRNRWRTLGGDSLITAGGAPAYVLMMAEIQESLARTRDFRTNIEDTISIARWLLVHAGLAVDLARGSVPPQNVPLPGAGNRISWNSVSRRVGFSVTALPRLTLRGSYARSNAPLAGRYLDYGNPASLGGLLYLWNDQNEDGQWQPAECGALAARFGGLYSAIDRNLRRPNADEFNVATDVQLPRGLSASLRLFRRDEKNRLAVVNTGVPPNAFTPVEILDSGPDSLTGTFDDQRLIVYSQDASTLGQDHFLLTNPEGLRMTYRGAEAHVAGGWKFLSGRLSFMAVKSHGPTNPGNSLFENDAGVTGSLFMDPNTAINAAGRSYFDRAYTAQAQMAATFPKRWGGLELASTANYLDGLPFGRRVLVTGLPQGPFLMAATVRGSPEGGNRAEHVLDWGLSASRAVPLPAGSVKLTVDIMNLLNSGNKVRESDISGPLFNKRLPVAIQSPRHARVTIEFSF